MKVALEKIVKLLTIACLLPLVQDGSVQAQALPVKAHTLVYALNATCLDTVLLFREGEKYALREGGKGTCREASGFRAYLWGDSYNFVQVGKELHVQVGPHRDLLASLDATMMRRQITHQEFIVTLADTGKTQGKLPYFELRLRRTIGPKDKLRLRWNETWGILSIQASVRNRLRKNTATLISVDGEPLHR